MATDICKTNSDTYTLVVIFDMVIKLLEIFKEFGYHQEEYKNFFL